MSEGGLSMQRTRLVFREMSEIVGSDGLSVALLTDPEGLRALSVVCDKAMTDQMSMRLRRVPGTETMLPEVLLAMLQSNGHEDLELMVYDVEDGQYKVTLLDKRTLTLRSIRMSDAMLLSYIARVPLYINEQLMQRQCTPYIPNSGGIAIPINTLGTDRLNVELKRAIDNENYRLASHLHQELQRRNKDKTS